MKKIKKGFYGISIKNGAIKVKRVDIFTKILTTIIDDNGEKYLNTKS